MKRCDMEPTPRVKESGPESTPIRSPRFNPFIRTPPTPTNPPIVKPNVIRKSKYS